jgi:hypothetical protein
MHEKNLVHDLNLKSFIHLKWLYVLVVCEKQLINNFPTIIGQRGVNEVAFKHGSMQTNFLGESQNFMIFK